MLVVRNSTRDSGRSLVLGVSLIVFFIAVYFLTYSGYAISRDEWFLFDATESMARRGNMEQNYQFDAYPPFSLKTAQPPSADTEPLQPILAAPLFLIAQAPGDYELWVAVYYWETPADRLPVTEADGQALGDHAVLTTITVGP
jgi:hypothetical protein